MDMIINVYVGICVINLILEGIIFFRTFKYKGNILLIEELKMLLMDLVPFKHLELLYANYRVATKSNARLKSDFELIDKIIESMKDLDEDLE